MFKVKKTNKKGIIKLYKLEPTIDLKVKKNHSEWVCNIKVV